MTPVPRDALRLDGEGYVININQWVGRLGNQIIQLSGAINVARNTKSRVTFPKCAFIRRAGFDFTEGESKRPRQVISGPFLYQNQCYQYPIQFDSVRRSIFLDHLRTPLMTPRLSERLRGMLLRTKKISPDTLVINMRSGRDIFRTDPPPQNDYMQPPVSFYKSIIETHGYDKCLIVTEPDRANPVIQALQGWKKDIEIKQHVSIRDDIETVLQAEHLVMAHSSFSWILALMSTNLKVLHQPHTFRVIGVDDYEIHTYKSHDYIEPGTWTGSAAQLTLMVDHPTDQIEHLPPQKKGSGELSAFW